ncbi:hypothetical protein KCU65_g9255, partial [Aureobasidium melanogenum]
MPPAKASGFFHTEEPLNIDEIADIQDIRDETTNIVFTHEHEYKGVLFMMVAQHLRSSNPTKRQKVEFPAIVLGQSQKEPGKIVLLKRPGAIFQTVFGTEMKQAGGIGVGNVHWCSGLQIKWVPHVTPSTQVETGLFKEKLIQDMRVKLVKDLFNLMNQEDDWSDIDWDEVEATIDNMQRQLNAANSPKQRQQQGGKKVGDAIKAKKADAEQEESSEDEDWTDDSKHVVHRCKFKIDKSKRLNDEEKARVKLLMKQYKIQKPEDFEQYNHELASLLNKAFKASFDVQILHDFTKARKTNSNIRRLKTFARFAAWWENRKQKASSRSLEKRIPRNVLMWNARNLVRSCFRERIW